MTSMSPARTRRLGYAESAAAFLDDLMGTKHERTANGRWSSITDSEELRRWGMTPQPIVRTDQEIMAEAAFHGWMA